MNDLDIIRKPILTEKSQVAKSKYDEQYFEVDKRANKLEIKRAFEAMFEGVEVELVRTKVKKPVSKVKQGKKIKTPKIKVAMIKIKKGSVTL